MGQEQTVFSQLLQSISYDDFYICVRRYDGNKGIRRFSCWEQFLAMAFAQLTYRESLRDIEVCLAAHQKHLYRSGFRSVVKRSTLADANDARDWRIYADFAHTLIQRARPCMRKQIWDWISTEPSTHWMRPRSIFACRCFLGRHPVMGTAA